MSVLEQKKEHFRAALQELGNPTSKTSTYEAMKTFEAMSVFVCDAWARNRVEEIDGSIGDFVGGFFGDDDFKEELFSAQVIQDLITVAQDKNASPRFFSVILFCLLLSLQQQHRARHRFRDERWS
jgi:hypothetical protein